MNAHEKNKLMHKRFDIWFTLSVKQRERLHELGHCQALLSHVSINDFNSVTKSKKLRKAFKVYKFGYGLRLIGGNNGR